MSHVPAGIETASSPRRHADVRSGGRLWSALGVALAAVGCAPPGPRTPVADVEVLRHSLQVGPPLFATVSYLRGGDASAPRVILVHGTPGAASGWADYLLPPPGGLDVLAIDRPGFGDSGPDRAVPGLAAQAAAVTALLPTDGRPVVLVGHSLGGAVVARVAAEQRTRISGIVLLAASLDPAQEQIHPMQRVGDWPPLRGMLPRAIRNANTELMALKPELAALAEMLPRITSKVLIVHGTSDDLVPVANVPFMQARLTGARCVRTVLLDGRNHFLPWNSMDVVNEALRAALEPAC